MTNDDRVERVARALYLEHAGPEPMTPWDNISVNDQCRWWRLARAALSAREAEEVDTGDIAWAEEEAKKTANMKTFEGPLRRAYAEWRKDVDTPTSAMIFAGASVLDHPSVFMGGPSEGNRRRAAQVWEAMRKAAPSKTEEVDTGWRDIATAPRDGTPILWTCHGTRWVQSVIHWPEYSECFEVGYWQPLPAPPNPSGLAAPAGSGLRVTVDRVADAAYIYLQEIGSGGVAYTLTHASPSVNLDFDKDDRLVGIEVLDLGRLPETFLQKAEGLAALAARSAEARSAEARSHVSPDLTRLASFAKEVIRAAEANWMEGDNLFVPETVFEAAVRLGLAPTPNRGWRSLVLSDWLQRIPTDKEGA